MGLPLFIATDEWEIPIDIGVTAQGPKLKINAETRLWETPSREAFRQIFRAFEDQGAVMDSVQWFGIGFIILAAEEPLKNWKKLFLGFINGHYVGYVIGEKVMEERALPGKSPVGRNLDDEKHDPLHPGKNCRSGHQRRGDVINIRPSCPIPKRRQVCYSG
ncbi:MAG: hypothetical protein Q9172_002884 [Xanthocarpia lactea]